MKLIPPSLVLLSAAFMGIVAWSLASANPLLTETKLAPPLPSQPVVQLDAPMPPDDGELGTAIESGIASFVGPRFGPLYLALPGGPGHRVTICAIDGEPCVTRTSTDAGPSLSMQRAGRVADLSYRDFAFLCRCQPYAVGLIRVTVADGPIPLPATDWSP